MTLIPTNNVTPFAFDGREVRATSDGDTTWFVAKDVCEALEIPWRGNTLDSIKDEWKGMREFRTPGGMQSLTVISETAVYKLAFRSRKKEAERFTDWIAGEVLPALKRTGRYEIQPQATLTPLDALEQMLTAMRTQERRLELLEGGQVEIEHQLNNQPISAHADKRNTIYKLVHELGNALGGTYQIGLSWRRFKLHFGLSKYDALPVHRYDEAVALLRQWIADAQRDTKGLYN